MCTVSGKLGLHALMFVLYENSFRYFFSVLILPFQKQYPTS